MTFSATHSALTILFSFSFIQVAISALKLKCLRASHNLSDNDSSSECLLTIRNSLVASDVCLQNSSDIESIEIVVHKKILYILKIICQSF